MQKTYIILPEIKLVGIQIRTDYETESSPDGKISGCVGQYFSQKISERIPDKKGSQRIYCVYAEYSSDYRGEYTFFMGEEVDSLDNVPDGLKTLTIQPQNYVKFTSDIGSIPDVIINSWQEIWQMPAAALGERNYIADFEIYDARAADPKNTVIDIYVGVR